MHNSARSTAGKRRATTTEAMNARRERNRKAQNEFRRRRQMAEKSRELRLQQLEDVVGEMTAVLTDFCSAVLKNEVAAKDPNLMACLQRSAARIIALGKIVDAEEAVDAKKILQHPKAGNTDFDDSIDHEVGGTPQGSHEASRSVHADDRAPQVSSDDSPTWVAHESTSPELHPYPVELINSDNHDGNDNNSNALSDINPWPTQRLSPQIRFSPWVARPFPLRLVETTITQAYLFLSGDIHLSSEDVHRAFGNTLRLRTREQLISHMHWLLGSGSGELYQAAGMAGALTQPSFIEKLSYGLGTSFNGGTAQDFDIDGVLKRPYSQVEADAFLTAFGVYKELDHLGARILDPETMEISITSFGLSTSRHGSEREMSGAGSYPHSHTSHSPVSLTIRLNVSLLASNLTSVAVCLARGPVYPRHELARAVQASVILAQGGNGTTM